MSAKRKFAKQFDRAWGIDRYPSSGAFGELVVEAIALWDKPGGVAVGATVVHAVLHNTRVRVKYQKDMLDGRTLDKRTWYLVCDVEHEERTGWVLESLLRDRGAEMFDE